MPSRRGSTAPARSPELNSGSIVLASSTITWRICAARAATTSSSPANAVPDGAHVSVPELRYGVFVPSWPAPMKQDLPVPGSLVRA